MSWLEAGAIVLAAGILFVALGAVGAVLPLLPTRKPCFAHPRLSGRQQRQQQRRHQPYPEHCQHWSVR